MKGAMLLKKPNIYLLNLFLIFMLFFIPVLPAYAQEKIITETADSTEEMPFYTEQTAYSDYYHTYIRENRPEKTVLVQGSDYISIKHSEEADVSAGSFGSTYHQENKDQVLIWNAPDGTVSYQVSIPETGIYCLYFSYLPIPANMTNIEFSILIDGNSPYDTASRATLNKAYINSEEIHLDKKGNQVRPTQIQTGIWMNTPLMDIDGLFNDPLIFYLEQGIHEISFVINKGYFALDYFQLYTPETLPDYADYRNSIHTEITPENTPSALIRIEGENAVYKSDPTLYPTADSTD